MSTVLFHDYFSIRGGGERLVLDLARHLGAELVYGYRTDESYEPAEFPARNRNLHLPRFARRRGLRIPVLAHTFSRHQALAAQHPLRIFSGVTAPFAAPPSGSPGRNVFYCHTPPRFLYDQADHFKKISPLPQRLGMAILGQSFRRRYEAAIGRMDIIIANSENIRRRIATSLGRESIVLHPPVDIEAFSWAEPQGYYLSTARLTPLKRVDRIVDAFLKMPDRRLIVTSGGEEEGSLRARAEGASNISFTGWTSEAELRRLVAAAIATIYVPVDEDFGISPVESMAAGKPVIGVAEGGLLETVIDGETGSLLHSNFTPDDLVRAVLALDAPRAMSMRMACERRATAFDRRRFLDGMSEIVGKAKSHA